ncbi:hypothetical protein GCM10022254_40970 [Actinomadura meridiana]|uniref:DUF1266 domain-containing protein n=1 Tax=Actinomadura meridiana TaxID=559626 RepID=A0ABP8C7F3_9ACTN
MGEDGQLDALERAVEGTLAEGSFEFDGDVSVLRIEGSFILTTGWLLSCGVAGIGLLLAGAVLSLTGSQDAARWALAPGAVLLVLVPGLLMLLRFTPLSAMWPDLELRFAERTMVHRSTRVPFGDLRPEHLVWKNGRFFRRLYVRHPSLRRQLAGFFGSEERQAVEFERRLWDLISAPGLPRAAARPADGLIARDELEPPFVERLIELVRVRYDDEGGSYTRLVPPLLRDEPGADASEEGAELALFLHQLFNDRNHAVEELHRLKALADPALRANVGRFLIWDYARAPMLYRWGHMVGWLTEEYCWERMLPLALDIQRRYSSWRDMATCYLQGRLLWSGGAGKAQDEYERLIDDLVTNPRSPWNLVPFDLDLTRDWP